MQQEAITGAIVVGHSVSGVWLQLLTVQAAERISRVVFLDAIVLKNGESFISNAVGPAQVHALPCANLVYSSNFPTLYDSTLCITMKTQCSPLKEFPMCTPHGVMHLHGGGSIGPCLCVRMQRSTNWRIGDCLD